MKFRITRSLILTLAMTAWSGSLCAQVNVPPGPSNYEHDMQLFAPFDLDLDNMVDDQWSGYTFEYNKLFWWYTGERTTIGSPNVTTTIDGVAVNGVLAEIIYRDNAQDEGDPPAPHVIHNSLTNVAPRAAFAMGDRYEVGYQDQGNGWLIGVLDGPQVNQREFYGFTPRETDGGLPPFINDDYTDGSDEGPGTGPTAGGDLRAFGFGSVPVLFETPAGYLFGFRDYLNNVANARAGTQAGPMLYVGNYGAEEEGDDDELPDVFRLADDLDEDGTPGSGFILDDEDNIILIFTDFDDLHEFNVFFNSVAVRSKTQLDGVEAMWTHNLTNQHYMEKFKNNRVTMAWGARFLRLEDDFRVDAEGSILGRSFWDTSYTNNIVGPQVALQWVNQRQRWRVQTDARFMLGYNVANWDQRGLVGEELIPGALNRPLYARPTAFAHGLREQELAPVGELRVKASYHFTKAFAINMGYTGSVMSNIRRAAPSVRYALPDMGYVDAGTQTMLSNGFDLGLEFTY